MGMAEIFFDAVFNMFSVYIIFRVLRLFLEKRQVSWILGGSVWIVIWAVNWGIYYKWDNFFTTMGSMLFGTFVAAVILFEGSMMRKALAAAAAEALGLIMEDCIWVFARHFSLSIDKTFGSLLSSVLFMLTVLLLEKRFYYNKTDMISVKSQINIIVILAGSIFVGEILVKAEALGENRILLGSAVLCLMNVSTFFLYDKINEAYMQKAEKEAAAQNALMYEKQFLLMEQSQKNIQALQHDMKNHMLLIRAYLEKKEHDGALGYIDSVTEFMKVDAQFVNSGNVEIDAVLNYAFARAEKLSCQIETKIEVPENNFMPVFDLNVLLGNLLDNALEALERAGSRYLYVSLRYGQGIFLVNIYNTFDGVIKKDGKRYLTRKPDGERHGIGLQNVEEIVDKYNGEIVRNVTDDMFKTDIVLYISAMPA